MGMLGKDLLDIFRPRTHVRAEFGETEYWVENDPRPILYGAVLTELLDVNAEEYKNCLSLLRETVPEDEAYRQENQGQQLCPPVHYSGKCAEQDGGQGHGTVRQHGR